MFGLHLSRKLKKIKNLINMVMTMDGSGTEKRQKSLEKTPEKRESSKNINIYSSPVAGPSRCWKTPSEKHTLYYEEIEKKGYKVPTPFKKCLIFPNQEDIFSKTSKQKRKKIPAVVSSVKYREFYEASNQKKKKQKVRK